MIWITGDAHGSFGWLARFCSERQTSKADTMVILGDACINYFGPVGDETLKTMLEELPITLLCIHGNHEMRPARLASYALTPWRGGLVYQQAQFPSLLFAKDGEVYDLDGIETLVVGGAYSVDCQYRLGSGKRWWDDEQPSAEIRQEVEAALARRAWRIDAILTHTTPLKYDPVEAFLAGFDQSMVDKSTEIWLDQLEERTDYGHWFCGHHHIDKEVDRLTVMMFAVREWQQANGRPGNESDFWRV